MEKGKFMKPKELVDERSKTHGDYGENAAITEALKMAIHGSPGFAKATLVQRNALDMIAQKLGRICAGDPNTKDHWDDIVGYATLVSERI